MLVSGVASSTTSDAVMNRAPRCETGFGQALADEQFIADAC